MIRKAPIPTAAAVFFLILAAELCGCRAPAASSQAAAPAPTLALIHGSLIDGTGAEALSDAVVLIGGDIVLAAGRRASVRIPEGVETIDLGGAFILPGFVNAHVHDGFDEAKLRAWARGGVTTVRDEGVSEDDTSLEDRMAFRDRAGENPELARLVSYGMMITVPDGYGNLFVTDPTSARQAVLDEVAAGVDGIKVSLENGYAGRTGLPMLTADELAAVVSAAHERGLLVSGHVTQSAYVQALLDAGVDDLGHLPYDYVPPETLRRLVEEGVALTPTFTVFRNYGAPAAGLINNLRRFLQAGGTVALGNDYGGGPGDFELGIPMYEIEMMARAGMTPMQIVVACTRNAALLSNLGDELGTLEPGKAADILVVGGDPLEDLQALRDVRLVVHRGAVIRNELQR